MLQLFLFPYIILLYIINSIGLYKIFTKASIPGWKAFVPVYSSFLKLEMIGASKRMYISWFVTIILFGWSILVGYNFGRVFGGHFQPAAFILMFTDIVSIHISLINFASLNMFYSVVGIGYLLQNLLHGNFLAVIALLEVIITITVSLPMIISLNYQIAKKFDTGHGTALGLLFLPFIFNLILGFGKKEYKK